jgi:TorA maturation chaperone TorD
MTTMQTATPSEAIELLSSMYLCKPSHEVIENWKRALAEDSSIFLADLKKATIEIDVVAEKEMEDLMWDYTRLFIGPYKLPCPPWESVYTSPKKLMMQDAADQAMRLYEEAGLAINTADIMPDHIGAELNFLAVLLQRKQSEQDGNEGYMRITEKLLNDHLLKWIPEFTRDMEDAAESSFYKALARATRDIVAFVGR